MGECFEVVNSKAIKAGDVDDQKVLFRYEDSNVVAIHGKAARRFGRWK